MNNDIIYVISKQRKPLMPTRNHCKVRHLLKEGKAVAIYSNPFTIRLKYDVPGYTQPVHEGIDTGRENIGDAASLEDGKCVYLADVKTNNKSVKHQMAERAGFRRERRRHDRQSKQRKAIHDGTEMKDGDDDVCRSKIECKSKKVKYPGAENPVTHKVIQGKEGKFNNRKRPEGWITPSARQLVQATLNEVKQTAKILPVSHLHVERVSFDFQKLENENIKAWEYGKGPLYGYKSYKDYINDCQDGKCLICGKNKIQYYHHINPQKNGKYDHVSNIAGLCYDCHYGPEGVHNCQETADRLEELKAAARQKYQVGLLNSVMPVLLDELHDYCDEHGIQMFVTDGKQTAATRRAYGLKKDHCIDAYAISLSDRIVDKDNVAPDDVIYMKRRFKKKSKGIIAKRNQRTYELDGKIIACNRHKATDQKEDSLEEFMSKLAETHTEKECNQLMHKLVIHPAKRTYTYRKAGKVPPAHPGDLIAYEKHNKTYRNTKRQVFIAVSVEYSESVYKKNGVIRTEREWKISYGDDNKARKAKYCRPIGSGSLQTIGVERTSVHIAKVEADLVKINNKKKRKPKAA